VTSPRCGDLKTSQRTPPSERRRIRTRMPVWPFQS
jgi:hypothetical protein